MRTQILIVDDEPKIIKILVRCLKEYQIKTTTDPEEAVQLLQSEQFDLLITDCLMPEMCGPQLISKARELQPTIKVVMVSGTVQRAEELMEQFARPDKFLNKPFRVQELLQAVSGLFEGQQAA